MFRSLRLGILVFFPRFFINFHSFWILCSLWIRKHFVLFLVFEEEKENGREERFWHLLLNWLYKWQICQITVFLQFIVEFNSELTVGISAHDITVFSFFFLLFSRMNVNYGFGNSTSIFNLGAKFLSLYFLSSLQLCFEFRTKLSETRFGVRRDNNEFIWKRFVVLTIDNKSCGN